MDFGVAVGALPGYGLEQRLVLGALEEGNLGWVQVRDTIRVIVKVRASYRIMSVLGLGIGLGV